MTSDRSFQWHEIQEKILNISVLGTDTRNCKLHSDGKHDAVKTNLKRVVVFYEPNGNCELQFIITQR